MLVLLPPSETKCTGGSGAPLELDALSHPELNPTRRKLADALVELSATPERALEALELSPKQLPEVERNAALCTSPTAPAITRYTGVLYDALDIGSLPRRERARADERLAVGSALFGIVTATDPIPAYRLSAGSALPGFGTLLSVWKPVLGPVLADAEGPVVDLRSGSYAALAPVPGAITVDVKTVDAAGRRKTVSHFNKAHKGRLARLLARSPSEASCIADVIRIARRGKLMIEQTGDHQLVVLLDG